MVRSNEIEETIFEATDGKKYNADISIKEKLVIKIQDDDYITIDTLEFKHSYPGFGVGTRTKDMIHFVASSHYSAHLLFGVYRIIITKLKDSGEVDSIKAYCL